jgi:hypothetical protein
LNDTHLFATQLMQVSTRNLIFKLVWGLNFHVAERFSSSNGIYNISKHHIWDLILWYKQMKMVGIVWCWTSSQHIYQTSKFATFEQNNSLVRNVGCWHMHLASLNSGYMKIPIMVMKKSSSVCHRWNYRLKSLNSDFKELKTAEQ